MGRSIVICAVLVASLLVSPAVQADAVTGFCAEYFTESSFVHVRPGQTSQFTVAFMNCGSFGWLRGTATQVDLAVCCPVDSVSANAAWATGGSWLSTTRYATTTTNYVGPGQIGWFTYRVTAPISAAPGDYKFQGELVLASTGQAISATGYFHLATILASISGTVRSAATGAGLPNVPVRADNAAGGATEAAELTDSSGRYELLVRDNFTYNIKFRPVASSGFATQVYNGQPSSATANGVVIAGANRTGIDASLGQAYTVSGTVTNKATGAPMAGVVVNAYMGASVLNCCYFLVDTVTSSSGTYSLSLGNADYRLSFAPPAASGLPVQWWRSTGTVTDWGLAEDMIVSGANLAGKNAALQ